MLNLLRVYGDRGDSLVKHKRSCKGVVVQVQPHADVLESQNSSADASKTASPSSSRHSTPSLVHTSASSPISCSSSSTLPSPVDFSPNLEYFDNFASSTSDPLSLLYPTSTDPLGPLLSTGVTSSPLLLGAGADGTTASLSSTQGMDFNNGLWTQKEITAFESPVKGSLYPMLPSPFDHNNPLPFDNFTSLPWLPALQPQQFSNPGVGWYNMPSFPMYPMPSALDFSSSF